MKNVFIIIRYSTFVFVVLLMIVEVALSNNCSSKLVIKDNAIFNGQCEVLKLTAFQTRYTLPTEDITKGRKKSLEAYNDHRPAFETSDKGIYEKETQSSLQFFETRYGVEIHVKSSLDNFSEYGISIPINFLGKANGGGWQKQYLLNNVFRSTDGRILYAYFTNPSGCNICVVAKNNLAGWKEEYSTYYCGHFLDRFNLYANFDKAYGPKERKNEISFLIMPVRDYSDLLDKLSKVLDVPFLDVDKVGGKIGDKIRLTAHGKIDAIKIVNNYSKVDKTVPFSNEMTIEYESDTYIYPVCHNKGKEIIGGEAEIYGYSDILDTYKKTMTQINLFRVFHLKNFEYDGNLCEQQCWMSAGLRFLLKYGDRMNEYEKNRLIHKLRYLLDVITETDPDNAIPRVTILNTPQSKYPAYNIFGLDRIQEEAFGMTILLDAYKYFGDQLYYDYLINTMDSFLKTYQKENGALERISGQDYSTVCCLIIPIIDVARFIEDRDKERSDRYKECATKLAWHICKRGIDFPTEGGGQPEDPNQHEMEEGSMSSSALSLLYYCNTIKFIPEFVKTAREILDTHEAWVMQSSSCGSKCSTLRWWETCWEGDQNGPALCAGHAWTIWRAEADWLYYKFTGDEKYHVKALNPHCS